MPTFFATLTAVIARDLRIARCVLSCIPWLTLAGVVAGIIGSMLFAAGGMPTLGWVAGWIAFGNWVMASAQFACDLSNEFGF